MAIEDQVNLKRDVSRNTENIDDIWEDMDSFSAMLMEQIELKKRVSILEAEIRFLKEN